jgi:hypothetical protein
MDNASALPTCPQRNNKRRQLFKNGPKSPTRLPEEALLNCSAVALDQSAPFGFSWGLVGKVPTPSLATRHANITLLIYRSDRLPSDELRDTEEIVVQVCKEEGLQQIVWISKFLSNSEERDKLDSIFAEGNHRYGKAEAGERETLRWNGGQTTVAAVSNDQGLHRIFMASNGPSLDACSVEHGHPVSDHWMQFLPKQ